MHFLNQLRCRCLLTSMWQIYEVILNCAKNFVLQSLEIMQLFIKNKKEAQQKLLGFLFVI